jgi:hypothetical protein
MRPILNIRSRLFGKHPPKKNVVSVPKQRSFGLGEFLSHYKIELAGLLVLSLVISFMYPTGTSFQFADLKEGRVYIGSEIIAPFTFPINKSEQEYAADRQEARESVPPAFRLDTQVAETQQDRLVEFIGKLDRMLRRPDVTQEELKSFFRDQGIVLSDEDMVSLITGFSSTGASVSTPVSSERVQKRLETYESLAKSVVTVVKDMYSVGILNVEKSTFPDAVQKLSIQKGGAERIEELEDLHYYHGLAESRNTLLEKLRQIEGLNEHEIKVGYQIAVHFLQPNVIYLEEEHETRIDAAVANVPLAKDQVLAGERIIDSHQRVTKQHIEKLTSLAMVKAERGETAGVWSRVIPHLAKFFITLIILGVLVIYLWRNQRSIMDDRKQVLLIGLVILLTALLTFVVTRMDQSAYLIPITMGVIIVTIFFNSSVGLVTAVTLSLLLGAMRGNEYSITFVSIFVSSIVILTVSKVRTRNWVLHSMAAAMGAYLVAIVVNDLLSYISFADMAQNVLMGILNGFFAPVFAYGLLIIFEFMFDMTTDMTLLELSDLNQPLLRQLAMQAPGTYHHSIVVGNLAEAATEAVGGNPLLARVGAYYHDIGKLEKPEYFVENQTKGRNPQEKLAPSMSALVLMNHVRKGVDMARAHGLPKEIEGFIYEHHGTALMSYFYQKASENARKSVSENEFRYPGPRPRRIETAIVMLADGIEASSRTLKEPTPNRIKNLVENYIDERFKSGELDDSPLTLKDLSKISEAFQKILNGIFHGRIDYPEKKEESVKAADDNKNG